MEFKVYSIAGRNFHLDYQMTTYHRQFKIYDIACRHFYQLYLLKMTTYYRQFKI